MKVLQTSPFPLGYRASEGQYSETSARFQPARVSVLLRSSFLPDMVVHQSIQGRTLEFARFARRGKQDDSSRLLRICRDASLPSSRRAGGGPNARIARDDNANAFALECWKQPQTTERT